MINAILQSDYINLLQTIFMVVGFYITAKTFINDGHSRKVQFFMEISGKYQDLKDTVIGNPDLERVFKQVPTKKLIISPAERAFAHKVIQHIYMIYFTIKQGQIDSFEGMEKDIQEIFSFTIPSQIWKEIKPYQDGEFVDYIGRILGKHT